MPAVRHRHRQQDHIAAHLHPVLLHPRQRKHRDRVPVRGNIAVHLLHTVVRQLRVSSIALALLHTEVHQLRVNIAVLLLHTVVRQLLANIGALQHREGHILDHLLLISRVTILIAVIAKIITAGAATSSGVTVVPVSG